MIRGKNSHSRNLTRFPTKGVIRFILSILSRLLPEWFPNVTMNLRADEKLSAQVREIEDGRYLAERQTISDSALAHHRQADIQNRAMRDGFEGSEYQAQIFAKCEAMEARVKELKAGRLVTPKTISKPPQLAPIADSRERRCASPFCNEVITGRRNKLYCDNNNKCRHDTNNEKARVKRLKAR